MAIYSYKNGTCCYNMFLDTMNFRSVAPPRCKGIRVFDDEAQAQVSLLQPAAERLAIKGQHTARRRISPILTLHLWKIVFNNSPKFEQNDLLQSTKGVSLVDTWIVSSIIRFTNIPIYNLPQLLEASASHTALCPISPILASVTPRRRSYVFYSFT
jgi:uncharacterized protein YunC (DUF1805 family)